MRRSRLSAVFVLFLVVLSGVAAGAGCATTSAEAGEAGGGEPDAYPSPSGPFLFQGPFLSAGPTPEIRLPWSTAQAMNVMTPTFASPGDVDRLEALCRESARPEPCLRSLRVCREKTCRLVPALHP